MCSKVSHTIFYWYFILCFNHYAGQKKTALDSTESRDCNAHLLLLPVTTVPDKDAFLTVRPQITFFHQNHFDEIGSVVTYIANAIYIVPTFPNLPVIVSTLQISEAPILYWDQQLQEFLKGKECCHNFINQDLTFLQPSTVHKITELDDSISSASDSTEESVITVQENNQLQEEDRNSPHSSLTEISSDIHKN